MKLAIITDTHFGIKNGSPIFFEYQNQWLNEQFFPKCIEEGIDTILHLGDFFDNRKFIGVRSMHFARVNFIEKLRENGLFMHIIPGNHDVSYRNTNALSSVAEILDLHPDVITVHHKPDTVDFDGLKITFIPWMNAENRDECMSLIDTAPSSVLLGHFDMVGFDMIGGGVSKSTHGLDKSIFGRWQMVLSGHYHTKSSSGNVTYLGTPYEQTWSDCGDPKYWHILDTGSAELRPIRNPKRLFNKLWYNASGNEVEDVPSDLAGTFVRVIVTNKGDKPEQFDRFIDKIAHQHPYELKILENFESLEGASVDDKHIDIADTSTLMSSYVDALETNLDKEYLKKIMAELLVEAQQSEMV